ncbi:MAG: hypothetical protein IAG13_39060, partial [Deltaproteobacteria bacterium]|nr:hypothetical protein [Nannocystaceae bacterium]
GESSGGGSGESSGGESSGGDPPQSRCGNGVVDDGETCDGGADCHPQCVAPGTILYTVRYDGAAHREDKGYGLALDEASESFYVVGFATDDASAGQDILLQRRWIIDGSLQWSRSASGGAGGEDAGENVALDAERNPIVVGIVHEPSSGGDMFMRKYTPTGDTQWTVTHDEQGGFDRAQGVAVTGGGAIVMVGNVEIDHDGTRDADTWMRTFDGDGNPVADALVHGHPGASDEAIDADAVGAGWIVTGRMTDDGPLAVWTAQYDAVGHMLWEDHVTADPNGDETRGVGMGRDPMGGSATAGVLANDIWVRHYDAFGNPGLTVTEDGPAAIHDEAADVAFVPDGSFVVVGFLDYATEGFATGDAWVRKYGPDGTPEWTDVYDGPAHEVDKALAVVTTDDLSAIVTGYETVPGQARDVWIRRYAI